MLLHLDFLCVKFRFFIFIVDFCLMWIKIFYMFMSYWLIL